MAIPCTLIGNDERHTAVSLNSDVDTNKELVAHGYSNLFAGLAGTVPNYLVYVNTLLCVRYPHYFVDYSSHKTLQGSIA